MRSMCRQQVYHCFPEGGRRAPGLDLPSRTEVVLVPPAHIRTAEHPPSAGLGGLPGGPKPHPRAEERLSYRRCLSPTVDNLISHAFPWPKQRRQTHNRTLRRGVWITLCFPSVVHSIIRHFAFGGTVRAAWHGGLWAGPPGPLWGAK